MLLLEQATIRPVIGIFQF